MDVEDYHKGELYYHINLCLFLVNIGIGIAMKSSIIVITSVIALVSSVYVYNQDYSKEQIWLLDQIALLAILIPAITLWFQHGSAKNIFAGLFFIAALSIYVLGLFRKLYTHSSKPVVREFWHLLVHILSFGGALFETEFLLGILV
jgi:hypothetical protein